MRNLTDVLPNICVINESLKTAAVPLINFTMVEKFVTIFRIASFS